MESWLKPAQLEVLIGCHLEATVRHATKLKSKQLAKRKVKTRYVKSCIHFIQLTRQGARRRLGNKEFVPQENQQC
jgi:hypothetical protein